VGRHGGCRPVRVLERDVSPRVVRIWGGGITPSDKGGVLVAGSWVWREPVN
jgi:hypothetical protein